MGQEDYSACQKREDEQTNLQELQATLEGKGHRLLAARDGASALATAAKATPDLVLLAIMMPDMDGYDVCRWLRSDPDTSEIPVIFLFALEHTQDKVKGFELGRWIISPSPSSPKKSWPGSIPT